MRADFLDAHERHVLDAQCLLNLQRWANADHLYGMAAECGLKRLMLAFGMPYDTSKDRPGDATDRTHIDNVWSRFESYRSGHHQGAGYILTASNPFADWHVAQRYAHRSSFDEARAKAHQAGSTLVHNLIQKAKREGLI